MKDLIGRRFGRLTVEGDSGERSGTSVLWRCKCDCGGEVLAIRRQLEGGKVRDCGCVPKRRKPLVTDLAGRRFGLLTVERDSGKRKNGYILWRCACDCGGAGEFTRNELISGRAESCGCVPRVYASKRQAEDLTGRQFGDLTVLRRAPNDASKRVRWLCRCACGKETTVQAMELKSGHTRSCGCKRRASPPSRLDLTGRRFGRLTVEGRAPSRKDAPRPLWHCRCDCGGELDVPTGSLVNGLTRSCGCLNREVSRKMHDHMHYQDDTCIEMLVRAQRNWADNKAGFRGLFLTKGGKYRASITFRKAHYTLGYYRTFDEAVRARLDAEQALHAGYIEAFRRYEQRAQADPQWAEQNAFYYEAYREDGGFRISTNG